MIRAKTHVVALHLRHTHTRRPWFIGPGIDPSIISQVRTDLIDTEEGWVMGSCTSAFLGDGGPCSMLIGTARSVPRVSEAHDLAAIGGLVEENQTVLRKVTFEGFTPILS